MRKAVVNFNGTSSRNAYIFLQTLTGVEEVKFDTDTNFEFGFIVTISDDAAIDVIRTYRDNYAYYSSHWWL